ncbi:HAMP domain-containing methyl-accepting chemotaxis protein [Geotalea sp. SG265]|uniref:methyl-accepting chemotaxis protein n=1 Tax=Geotalea sp. SG265 TaxID=2922867 RepID=UPI001FAEBAED|nr:HAMP domain-containing methyl-accepting chemotaxis protein [Geotalea sp. SG265]
MAKNLRFGSSFIRFALICGFIVSLAGIYLTVTMGHADSTYLVLAGAAFSVNALVALTVLLMLAARKMVKRVRVIADAMNRGAGGDLTARVSVDSGDELGTLGSSLNVMLQNLSGMTERVKITIQELGRMAVDIKEVSRRGVTVAEVQSQGVKGTTVAVQEINQSINEVALGVESLSRSSAENASSILEMSASIEEVAKHVEALFQAVEEVSSSIIEMASAEKEIGRSVNSLMSDSTAAAGLVADMGTSIKQVERNALNTAAISEEVRNDAESGRAAVEATISGIEEIRRASRTSFESIENLSLRAGNIGKITLVIDEIAEQTNLLALNASIIAAQAGEHGKGFAVVAGEIKDLAQRTGNSTREITDIIKGVQEETQRAVKAFNLAEQRIVEGEKLSHRSGEMLKKIVNGAQMATEQVNEIARTTVEQSQGSQEISKAMDRVADMVKQIAKATREQGRGSELIMSAAERMKSLTGQVKSSSQEQSSSSSLIVRSTENISSMIENIKKSCGAQAESSQRIVEAIEDIAASTKTTVDATRVMDGVAAGLSQQIDVLSKEMSIFKIESEKNI